MADMRNEAEVNDLENKNGRQDNDAVFLLNDKGNYNLEYGGWQFNKNYKNGSIKFETTKFGNPVISWGDYKFIKKLGRGVKTWWECGSRKKTNCRCFAVTVENRLVKLNGWHNH
ncbi:unnamed protein product [Leptidea sinapis]|uniref:FLYWCH-type domain-containing protein n=1 Tax=Leptidea sinapis TaxID=189913 RepID=A0A5E4PZM8_9NEOP|nr:unnamed protein product [Leptidea sinapis]